MKKTIVLGLMMLASFAVLAQNDWENPEVFQVGTEPSRATYWRGGSLENQQWNILLNGIWKFKYVHETADRPTDFYAEGFEIGRAHV